MTPKALSAEFLESELEDIGRFDPRRRDDLRAHIAALEADNAAGVEQVRGLLAVLWGPDFERRPAEIAAQRALAQPHPSAALLERHEKAMEVWTRVVGIAEKQGRSVGGALDDAEGHRKALVRARNEGLERAAKRCDAIRAEARDHDDMKGALRVGQLARDIRAMKEPEQ